MAILIVVVIIVALVAIFSLQNATPVALSFLFWKFQTSLAVTVFCCLLLGLVAGAGIAALILTKKRGRGKAG